MTWWIKLYLVIHVTLSIAGILDDYRDRRPTWFLVAAGLSNITVIYLFVSYWYPSTLSKFGLVAPIGFVLAMCWELLQAILDIRAMVVDGEPVDSKRPVVVATLAVIASMGIFLPAFVVAGFSAFDKQ